MPVQIDHTCPTCGYSNYKIVEELEEFAGTSAETEFPGDGFRRLPVKCQRHGCATMYQLFIKP